MFCSERFSSRIVRLAARDTLLLYTDGLLEAQDSTGVEYGIERLAALAASANRQPKATVDACLRDLAAFRGAPGADDDLTILAISRL
jgi:phosphoserine phosphatase RsbU/P